MRVLMVTREHPPYSWGGMSRVTAQIQKFFPEMGIDLTIIAPSTDGFKVFRKQEGPVEVVRVPFLAANFLTKIPSFSYFASRLVREMQNDYDIIYSHSVPLFCPLTRPLAAHFHGTRYGEYLACKQLKKPLHAFLNKLYIPFDRALIKNSAGVIVLSETMRGEIEATGVGDKNIEVIPNGVDAVLFRPLAERRFDGREKVILYTGRLDLRKGLDNLFYAFAAAAKTIKARLVVVGEGNRRKHLQSLAKKLSLPVEFKGKVSWEKLPAIYSAADIFVLPSLYEPFGLAALEAMACATPTIVSDACPDLGVPRFDKNSPDSLAALLRDCLSAPEELSRLSRAAFASSGNYAWKNIAGKIKDFLLSIVNR